MENFTNKLKNYDLKKEKIGGSFGLIGGLKRDYFLGMPTVFYDDTMGMIKGLNEVLTYYTDYILNMEAILDIWEKIETVQYINAGMHTEDGWRYNKHLFVINGITFEYRTGTGIKINNTYYDLYKLLFDAVYCLLDETSMLDYYTCMDDFLFEMGYDENIGQVRKGEKIFRLMQEIKENILKIWNKKDIQNIREYIEL